jgi:hypothetical protein
MAPLTENPIIDGFNIAVNALITPFCFRRFTRNLIVASATPLIFAISEYGILPFL